MMPGQRVLRERLSLAVVAISPVEERLTVALDDRTRVTGDGGTHGRVDHSQPPWNAAAANLLLDLHAWSRDTEATLRRLLSMTSRPRGGSDRNTARALAEILHLAEAAEDPVVAELVSWLEGWAARGLVALGEKDQARRLPQNPGEVDPPCPYCERHTLRFWASRGEVRCVNPVCRDGDGRRPVAQMDYSTVAGDWVLAWKDGLTGLPTTKREVVSQ